MNRQANLAKGSVSACLNSACGQQGRNLLLTQIHLDLVPSFASA